jgi:ABC-type uncharacterized transport system substrate-binding protein
VRRREFIGFICGAAAAWPLSARAQQSKTVAQIGYLTTGSLVTPEGRVLFDAFRGGLRDRGYMEGQNIIIEARGADGQIERFPALASELVGLKLDVIVVSNSLAAHAVQQATTTIPIVVTAMADPVAERLVASLAQPGGNTTGLTFLGPELVPKRLALLKEALPTISRVAALWHPGAYGELSMSNMVRETEVAARTLGVQLRLVAVQGPDELDGAFSAIVGERADALIVFPSPMLFTERRGIVDLAAKHRLPAMYPWREAITSGGLLAYGPNLAALNRRAASHVDKILKGAKPADLPVEQPTKFEFVVNLKTAKALGLVIPTAILASADDVIE